MVASVRWIAIVTALAIGTSAGLPLAAAGDGDVDISIGAAFTTQSDARLRADVYRPEGPGPFPGVLCIHGGAWLYGHRFEMGGVAYTLAKHGYVAVSIDYRLAPLSRFPAQLDDCKAALEWMRSDAAALRIDPQRIGAWGYSAGAHLATLLAFSQTPSRPEFLAADDPQRIRAVVGGGAPSDFRHLSPDDIMLAFWLGGTRRQKPDVYEAASPAHFVSPDDPPVFYYHGETDMVVGVTQPRAIVERLKEAGVPASFYPRPGAGHIQTFFDGSTVDKGIEFLDRRLKALPAVAMKKNELMTKSQ